MYEHGFLEGLSNIGVPVPRGPISRAYLEGLALTGTGCHARTTCPCPSPEASRARSSRNASHRSCRGPCHTPCPGRTTCPSRNRGPCRTPCPGSGPSPRASRDEGHRTLRN
eukprot:9244680-Heterocapsa_arctica.AAC.1